MKKERKYARRVFLWAIVDASTGDVKSFTASCCEDEAWRRIAVNQGPLVPVKRLREMYRAVLFEGEIS